MKKKNRASVSSKPIKMTDAELSKKLGHYQAMSVIWFWVGVVGAVSGAIFYFVLQNKALKSLLVAVLFFGGIFCASFFSGGAQKKLKVLMQEQMGDFFRAEWEKAFGPDIHTQEMRIDEPFMRAHHLLDGKWEECTVENFHAIMAAYIFLPLMYSWIMCTREDVRTMAMKPAGKWSLRASSFAAGHGFRFPRPFLLMCGRRIVHAVY